MPLFSKVFKGKDASSTKGNTQGSQPGATSVALPKQKWEDAWTRKEVAPTEVQELLHVCTEELKSRALDTPFLLLPFRPASDPSAARNFIRSFFKAAYGSSTQYHGDGLYSELRIIDPMVLCSIMKWCWSRLPGGVVTWNTYELFRVGENDSNMAKHAFDKIIPVSVDSEARQKIIFDFFDLLAAIAAHGKTNGLGGRKLSRLAGWWAFDHSDMSKGFDGGYHSWESAANATSHLFFAYLRSLEPDNAAKSSGISRLPRSLQSLVSQTEYPPEMPTLLQTDTPKVVMLVDSVSPTPYALLRRAKHFEYRDEDHALQRFSAFDDPVKALTSECRRVLDSISATNSSAAILQPVRQDTNKEPPMSSPTDASWSRFEDIGFSSLLDGSASSEERSNSGYTRLSGSEAPRQRATSPTTDFGRPTTPSWADFLSSGFSDDANQAAGPASLLLPPDQILPPLNPSRIHSSQSHMRNGMRGEDSLEPGELASIDNMSVDETFWWVWMTSLAAEEPPARKAVFGRCAFIETEISRARWLVIEEQVRGASTSTEVGRFVVEKKSRFTFSKRGRTRRQSFGKQPSLPEQTTDTKSMPAVGANKISIAADQRAKVQAAAADLVQQQNNEHEDKEVPQRRGRMDEGAQSKTNSVLTLQPVIMKEAAPAMQWARKFDKETIRAKYLGNIDAGRGTPSPNVSATALVREPSNTTSPPTKSELTDREAPLNPADPSAPPPIEKDLTATPAVEAPPPPPAPAVGGMSRTVEAEPAIKSTTASHNRERTSSSVVSPTALNHTERKPVNTDDGTNPSQAAMGQPSIQNMKGTEQSPAQPIQPAVIAAAAAAQNTVSPSAGPQPNKLQKSKKGSTRGLKNLFNRKKVGGAEPMNGHTNGNSNGLLVPEQKTSILRRKPSSSSRVGAEPTSDQVTDNLSQGEPGPSVTELGEYKDDSPITGHSTVDPPVSDSADLAMPEGSNAFEIRPDATSRPFNTRAGALLAPENERNGEAPAEDFKTPMETSADPIVSELDTTARDETDQEEALTDDASMPQDRWAQIRKNAAERRVSEDQSRQSQQSVKTEKTDDGETSGEETIESRVARIKARVAELTSGQNMGKASDSA